MKKTTETPAIVTLNPAQEKNIRYLASQKAGCQPKNISIVNVLAPENKGTSPVAQFGISHNDFLVAQYSCIFRILNPKKVEISGFRLDEMNKVNAKSETTWTRSEAPTPNPNKGKKEKFAVQDPAQVTVEQITGKTPAQLTKESQKASDIINKVEAEEDTKRAKAIKSEISKQAAEDAKISAAAMEENNFEDMKRDLTELMKSLATMDIDVGTRMNAQQIKNRTAQLVMNTKFEEQEGQANRVMESASYKKFCEKWSATGKVELVKGGSFNQNEYRVRLHY